jgi:hypothetical protein
MITARWTLASRLVGGAAGLLRWTLHEEGAVYVPGLQYPAGLVAVDRKLAVGQYREMDPVTLVVTAVALGASAGLTETATTAIKDAYTALKGLLTRRNVDVSGVERRPESTAQRTALEETLTDIPDLLDDELVAAAQQVTDAVATDRPVTGSAIGVDLQRVTAEFLRVRAVRSDGTGVRVRDGEFTGGIDIGDVNTGPTPGPAGSGGDDPSRR